MSHFTVLVPAQNESELYERLIPYYEYGTSQERDNDLKRRGLVEFHNVEEEYREEYENDSVEMVKMPDGRLLCKWDNEFRRPGAFGTGSGTHEIPEHLELVQVHQKERYGSFGEFIEDWAGYRYDEKHETWGYYRGLNEKWDWYSVGGRWAGELRLKRGGEDDNALVRDVDWDAIRASRLGAIMEKYNTYHLLLDEVRNTGVFRSGQYEKASETWFEDGKRGEYCQEAFASLQDYALNVAVGDLAMQRKHHWFDTFQESADLFYKSREEYAAMFENRAMTYAFIDTEGRWYQRGEMGWWGMDDPEKGTPDYDTAFWNFIKSLDPDQRVYIVDCHI